jgi:hypothetical protein
MREAGWQPTTGFFDAAHSDASAMTGCIRWLVREKRIRSIRHLSYGRASLDFWNHRPWPCWRIPARASRGHSRTAIVCFEQSAECICRGHRGQDGSQQPDAIPAPAYFMRVAGCSLLLQQHVISALKCLSLAGPEPTGPIMGQFPASRSRKWPAPIRPEMVSLAWHKGYTTVTENAE